MRVFFIPPAGTAPFEFEMDGKVRIFFPPDQYWKKIHETYVVGMIVDPSNNKPKLDSKGEPVVEKRMRMKWVPDEDKNNLLAKNLLPQPENSLELSRGERIWLARARFREMRPFLKADEEFRNDHRTAIDAIRSSHATELAKLEKEREAIRIEMASLVENERQQLNRMKSKFAKKPQEATPEV